ncbi:hypothetical protein PspLS_01521 [Pyricularia sp. CBS 133598]|nr:hypothetical protein PspLS_01521 [Pyricularia sp. CBS 133598]
MSSTTSHISANGQTTHTSSHTPAPPSTGSSHAYAAALALGPAMPWSGEAYKAMTMRKSGHYAKKPQHKTSTGTSTSNSSSSSGWRSLLKGSSASKKKAAAEAEAHAAAKKLESDDDSVYVVLVVIILTILRILLLIIPLIITTLIVTALLLRRRSNLPALNHHVHKVLLLFADLVVGSNDVLQLGRDGRQHVVRKHLAEHVDRVPDQRVVGPEPRVRVAQHRVRVLARPQLLQHGGQVVRRALHLLLGHLAVRTGRAQEQQRQPHLDGHGAHALHQGAVLLLGHVGDHARHLLQHRLLVLGPAVLVGREHVHPLHHPRVSHVPPVAHDVAVRHVAVARRRPALAPRVAHDEHLVRVRVPHTQHGVLAVAALLVALGLLRRRRHRHHAPSGLPKRPVRLDAKHDRVAIRQRGAPHIQVRGDVVCVLDHEARRLIIRLLRRLVVDGALVKRPRHLGAGAVLAQTIDGVLHVAAAVGEALGAVRVLDQPRVVVDEEPRHVVPVRTQVALDQILVRARHGIGHAARRLALVLYGGHVPPQVDLVGEVVQVAGARRGVLLAALPRRHVLVANDGAGGAVGLGDDVHSRLPPLPNRQPRMPRPRIPRPVGVQIDPKHRITRHRPERDPALRMHPPYRLRPCPLSPVIPCITTLTNIPPRHLHKRKPRLPTAAPILQPDQKTRNPVPAPPPSDRPRPAPPVVVQPEPLTRAVVPHQLRRAHVVVRVGRGTHEASRARQDARHGRVVGWQAGRRRGAQGGGLAGGAGAGWGEERLAGGEEGRDLGRDWEEVVDVD